MIPSEVIEHIKLERPSLFESAFQKFFTWQELERLINLRPFVNTKRCQLLSSKDYSWPAQAWLTDNSSVPPSILGNELNHYLCFLTDASRANKTINSMCNQLEQAFPGGASDAHIYFTISNRLGSGLGIHWDFSHNLIVQMEGVTRLMIWDEEIEPSYDKRNIESIASEPTYDWILNPGDAVFVPRYHYHWALSQTKRMSISFPILLEANAKPQDRYWIELA